MINKIKTGFKSFIQLPFAVNLIWGTVLLVALIIGAIKNDIGIVDLFIAFALGLEVAQGVHEYDKWRDKRSTFVA